MLAYHNDPEVKARYLQRVKDHQAADEIIQQYGYWANGKGCAVGCTLHGSRHKDYEVELGVPEELAYLEDIIFEGLPVGLAKLWPTQFLEAIPVGKDLTKVWHQYAIWLLRDSRLLMISDRNREAIAKVIEHHVRSLTETVSAAAWGSEAGSAWEAAARSAARSAAEAAAWSAARSARSAWAAAEAARSAARSAAARSAAWCKMSKELLRLLSN